MPFTAPDRGTAGAFEFGHHVTLVEQRKSAGTVQR